eukprot:Lithocolla_globosa_v1_NODE_2087_length_2166_cov_20.599057.p1 type:complete len:117 gc:universal NODE_2087_length_2166_cov_20.599057:1769-1419(-)
MQDSDVLINDVFLQIGFPKFIAYDDACHLFRFVQNRVKDFPIAEPLALCTWMVDRLHFKNHIDKWCKENMNPANVPGIEFLSTESCENTFVWLSKYRFMVTNHVRHEVCLLHVTNV